MADGLAWQKLELSLAGGLQQKADDRARPHTFLDRAVDIQYDELGGVQTRYPFGTASGSIFGGGSITAARRIERNGNEIVMFTDTAVYSLNAQLGTWVLRGTHLAVAVDERVAFASTGDQLDGDRAELNGTIVFAWTEGGIVRAAAFDKTTGAVLMSPFSLLTASTRPRLVALTTKILLFVEVGGALNARAIDPASPATALLSGPSITVLANGVFNLYYDVVKVAGLDQAVGACRRVTTTSYTTFTVTAGLTLVTSTKGRTCDGPVAVSTTPAGTNTQVIRANGTNIQGDYLTTSTLADVTTGQAVGTADGTPVNQIAACHRSVANSGAFRCYAFWSSLESTTTCAWQTKFNFVDTAGTIGTQARFVGHLGPASRAFDYNGAVYLWMAFGGQSTFNGSGDLGFQSFALQNTYFLFRDDQYLSNAKAVATHGGGLAATTGRLPGVALTSGATTFSWCGTERRRLALGGVKHVGFASRAPVDVTFEFDSNRARRCARIGATLYVSGGEIMTYDGVRLVEAGHHIYPWVFGLIDAGGGSVGVGTYAYKITWRYENAQGESDRSTTATIGKVTVSGSSTSLPAPFCPLTATHKTVATTSFTTAAPAVEVWRTAVAPDSDSPFFLVSSLDPTALTNPNRYIPNDHTAASLPTFNDFAADATVIALEANPENNGDLENLAPPAAQLIIATDTRIFLGQMAGDPDCIRYSRLREEGKVVSFHDTLRAAVPHPGGDMTGLTIHSETLTVFRETAIYRLPGDGLNNLGQGNNYVAFEVSSDVGAVSQEAIARVTSSIGTIFKSLKGWQLLRPGWDVQYIGEAVSDYDSETVYAINVVETQHQVRILTSGRMLIWDYLVNKWGEQTVTDGVHATMYNNAHVYLAATGTRTQSTSYTTLTYGMDIETAWIKLDELQGATRCRLLQPLGEYRSSHLLRVRIAYNYLQSYVDDRIWTPSPTTVGGPLQVKVTPKRPVCQSIKIRLTAVAESARASLVTTALSPQLATFTTVWTSTWTTVATLPGELGNQVTMSVACVTGDVLEMLPQALPFTFTSSAGGVVVVDHFAWSITELRWIPDLNNVGVLVSGSVTVAELETAIAAESSLVLVSVHDVAPTKVIDVDTMIAGADASEASFSGGAFGAPTGEALKLTGLGLEVGIERGLFRQLPSAQRL